MSDAKRKLPAPLSRLLPARLPRPAHSITGASLSGAKPRSRCSWPRPCRRDRWMRPFEGPDRRRPWRGRRGIGKPFPATMPLRARRLDGEVWRRHLLRRRMLPSDGRSDGEGRMQEIVPDVLTWSRLSERHDYDFNGHLIRHPEGNLCIDPVEPIEADLDQLAAIGATRVLLTNRNHTRAANLLRARLGARTAIHPKDIDY